MAVAGKGVGGGGGGEEIHGPLFKILRSSINSVVRCCKVYSHVILWRTKFWEMSGKIYKYQC